MSMTAKNNESPIYSTDKEGTEVHIGDEIVYARGGIVMKTHILGLTQKGIYILDTVIKWEVDKGYTRTKKRVYKRWLNFLLFKRNEEIPEEIKPFLK